MDGASTFRMTSEELMCLSALCGYEKVINVEYVPEVEGDELAALFQSTCGRMREKGWLEEDFDGNVSVRAEIRAIITLASDAECFWLVQVHTNMQDRNGLVSTLYYKDDSVLLLEEEDEMNYKAILSKGTAFCREYLLSLIPFFDIPNGEEPLSTDEVVRLAKDNRHLVLNISKYSIVMDSLTCEDTATCAAFEKGGTYLMALNDSDEQFMPMDKEYWTACSGRIFTMGVMTT